MLQGSTWRPEGSLDGKDREEATEQAYCAAPDCKARTDARQRHYLAARERSSDGVIAARTMSRQSQTVTQKQKQTESACVTRTVRDRKREIHHYRHTRNLREVQALDGRVDSAIRLVLADGCATEVLGDRACGSKISTRVFIHQAFNAAYLLAHPRACTRLRRPVYPHSTVRRGIASIPDRPTSPGTAANLRPRQPQRPHQRQHPTPH